MLIEETIADSDGGWRKDVEEGHSTSPTLRLMLAIPGVMRPPVVSSCRCEGQARKPI